MIVASVTHAASGRRGLPRDKSDSLVFLTFDLMNDGRGFLRHCQPISPDQDDRQPSADRRYKHLDERPGT